jgi:hypothetical protein
VASVGTSGSCHPARAKTSGVAVIYTRCVAKMASGTHRRVVSRGARCEDAVACRVRRVGGALRHGAGQAGMSVLHPCNGGYGPIEPDRSRHGPSSVRPTHSTRLGEEAERFSHERRPPTPSRLLRMRVHFRTRALDEQLANGANPLTDARLALRACQLTDPRTRHALADSIERLIVSLGDAGGAAPVAPLSAVDADAARAARADLARLADRLRAHRPVTEMGVAMVNRLLTDGRGALYNERSPLPLSYCVRMAVLSLEP